MIGPELGKAGFIIGFFIIVVAGGLLFNVEPQSAEFVVSLFMLGLGVLFTLGIVVLVRMGTRRQ